MNFYPLKLFQGRNFNILNDTYVWKYVHLDHFVRFLLTLLVDINISKLTGVEWIMSVWRQEMKSFPKPILTSSYVSGIELDSSVDYWMTIQKKIRW